MNDKKYETYISDGVYVELFAVKNGVKCVAKTLSMQDATRILVNGLMDGVKNLWEESHESHNGC